MEEASSTSQRLNTSWAQGVAFNNNASLKLNGQGEGAEAVQIALLPAACVQALPRVLLGFDVVVSCCGRVDGPGSQRGITGGVIDAAVASLRVTTRSQTAASAFERGGDYRNGIEAGTGFGGYGGGGDEVEPPFEYKRMLLSHDSFGAANNGSVLAEAEERAAAQVAYSGGCFPCTQSGSPEMCVRVCACVRACVPVIYMRYTYTCVCFPHTPLGVPHPRARASSVHDLGFRRTSRLASPARSSPPSAAPTGLNSGICAMLVDRARACAHPLLARASVSGALASARTHTQICM